LFSVFRDPRGFGFIQYFDPEDAADAKYHMDRQFFLGREITVVFAEENRKKPSEMRAREGVRYCTSFSHPLS
jgi:FUS-interacting serine-arginine-rich protein 1